MRRIGCGICAWSAVLLCGAMAAFADSAPVMPAAGQAATQPASVTISTKAIGGGEAVGGVKIDLYAGGEQKVMTGENGEVTVTLPAGDFSTVSMETSKEGWAPMVWRWSRKGSDQALPGKIEIAMDKSVEIGGVAVDGRGNVLPGAMVLVTEKKSYGPRQSLFSTYDAVTADGDGKWVYKDGAAGVESVQIGASHPLCLGAYGFYELKPFDDLEGLRQKEAQVVLKRSPAPLELTVTDEAGKPIAGAKVGYGADRVASNELDDMLTDGDGHLSMGVPLGGEAVVTVKAKGYQPDMWTGPGAATVTEIKMVLKPAKALTGKVVDQEGKPVAGAMVFFDTWRGKRTLVDQVKTGADGTFSWDGAPVDVVLAAVQGQGLLRQDKVELMAGAANVVTLKKSTVLRGKVVNEATGEAIRQYHVVWGIAFENQPVIWQRDQPAPKIKEDGSFETTFSGFYTTMKLKVEAPGFEPVEGDAVTTTAGGVVEQVYRMKKGKNIEGTVMSAMGDPAAGVKVWVATPTDEVRLEGTQIQDSRDLLSVVTDGKGHFVFDPQGDAYGLYITADEGYAAVAKEELEKSGGKVTLTPWGRIEGTVKEGGKAAAHAKVSVQYGKGSEPLTVVGGGRINFYMELETDGVGKYAVERAFQGTVQAAEMREVQMARGTTSMTVKQSALTAVEGGKTAHVDVGE